MYHRTMTMNPETHPVEDRIRTAELIMEAYPDYDLPLMIPVEPGSTTVSTFRVCRLCGLLVLDSMSMTHVRVSHL